jgi:hypothetical protein
MDGVVAGDAYVPGRSDAVEAWLKAWRDSFLMGDEEWNVIDSMIDEYRLAADTGSPLPIQERHN